MSLEIVWFWLIAVLWAGYFLLEGFDFGVGMLLPALPRSERERSTMFESIGPVWDGNEVWLVVAGGATFAAFPAWYATMFSGFYLALRPGGELGARAATTARRLSAPAILVALGFLVWTVAVAHQRNSRGVLPTAIPAALAGAALLLAAAFAIARRDGWAFAMTALG